MQLYCGLQTNLHQIKKYNENHKSSIIKPVSNITLNNNDGYDTLVDKFLDINDGEELNTAYAKKIAPILNQRIEEKIENYMKNKEDDAGFDLSEAICPKETLEDIMKAFDFYPDNQD